MIIHLNATENKLTNLHKEKVVRSGSVNYYEIQVSFSPDWNGLSKAVFIKSPVSNEAQEAYALLNGHALIPYAAIENAAENGEIQVYVIGTGAFGKNTENERVFIKRIITNSVTVQVDNEADNGFEALEEGKISIDTTLQQLNGYADKIGEHHAVINQWLADKEVESSKAEENRNGRYAEAEMNRDMLYQNAENSRCEQFGTAEEDRNIEFYEAEAERKMEFTESQKERDIIFETGEAERTEAIDKISIVAGGVASIGGSVDGAYLTLKNDHKHLSDVLLQSGSYIIIEPVGDDHITIKANIPNANTLQKGLMTSTQVSTLNKLNNALGGYAVGGTGEAASAWGYIPVVKGDGGIELGKYIDLRLTSNDSVDRVARISILSGEDQPIFNFGGASSGAGAIIKADQVQATQYHGTYYGKMGFPLKLTLNGANLEYDATSSSASTFADGVRFYAPKTAGNAGQILKSNGSGTPVWIDSAPLATAFKLGDMTVTLASFYNAFITAAHAHENKGILDGITETDIEKWNNQDKNVIKVRGSVSANMKVTSEDVNYSKDIDIVPAKVGDAFDVSEDLTNWWGTDGYIPKKGDLIVSMGTNAASRDNWRIIRGEEAFADLEEKIMETTVGAIADGSITAAKLSSDLASYISMLEARIAALEAQLGGISFDVDNGHLTYEKEEATDENIG